MITKIGNMPMIRLDCVCGREVNREFDFTNDKGEHITGKRSVIQFSFVDASGIPTIGVGLKSRGFEFDFSPLAGVNISLFVSRFATDKSGVCLFTINGVDVPDGKK